MLLKRKRSDDELSCFSSSGIGYSSPMRSENGDIVMMETDIHSPTAMLSPMSLQSNYSRSSTPSHLHSRTFKRLRNGRPSDEEVHQNTMKMLYQAQQQPQQPHHIFTPPTTTSPMPPPPPATTAPSQKQQPSLHTFWKHIPAATTPLQPQQHQVATPTVENRATTCEDCGVGLGEEEDAMMDDGGYGFETYINTCSACARAVCFSCSVSNLGEQRRCLRCAGREGSANTASKERKWVGGFGWSSGRVSVC